MRPSLICRELLSKVTCPRRRACPASNSDLRVSHEIQCSTSSLMEKPPHHPRVAIINVECDRVTGRLVLVEDVRFHIAIISAAQNPLGRSEILRLHLVNRVLFGPSCPGFTTDQAVRQQRRSRGDVRRNCPSRRSSCVRGDGAPYSRHHRSRCSDIWRIARSARADSRIASLRQLTRDPKSASCMQIVHE